MKKLLPIIIIILALTSCTSQKKLAYLNNTDKNAVEYFSMNFPDYKIQPRDILYITIKAMLPDGTINDFLAGSSRMGGSYTQSEAGQYLYGYDVTKTGEIVLPVLGTIEVSGKTLEEARNLVQIAANQHFKNSIVECKLLSFKFTVIGEVRSPGTYINYNNYLTVLEAIGRAGGISDYGSRNKIMVVRPIENGSKTFNLNLQNKAILTNEAYYLLPNDIIIVEPEAKKIFNLNLPIYSFIITSVTSTLTISLLLINFFK